MRSSSFVVLACIVALAVGQTPLFMDSMNVELTTPYSAPYEKSFQYTWDGASGTRIYFGLFPCFGSIGWSMHRVGFNGTCSFAFDGNFYTYQYCYVTPNNGTAYQVTISSTKTYDGVSGMSGQVDMILFSSEDVLKALVPQLPSSEVVAKYGDDSKSVRITFKPTENANDTYEVWGMTGLDIPEGYSARSACSVKLCPSFSHFDATLIDELAADGKPGRTAIIEGLVKGQEYTFVVVVSRPEGYIAAYNSLTVGAGGMVTFSALFSFLACLFACLSVV